MKIYLACPYSHSEERIIQERFETVNRIAAKLIQQGYLVFSPISHSHPIAKAGDLPKDFDFWREYDKTFIDWCDKVMVVTLDGYRESRGIREEIDYARWIGRKVEFIEESQYAN